ncbi:MAG: amino acid permease [Janthinobacterium lividum]
MTEQTLRSAAVRSGVEAPPDDDKAVLHSMGYAQELLRGMRTFQNFAISFSIICILSGGINSFSQGLSSVGGASIGLGWPLACLVSLAFALAMGQIGSAYPTAGGLYHWGSILGGRGLGWLTAWFNLIGLVTVLAAINVGTYLFLVGALFPYLGIDTAALTPASPTVTSVLVQSVIVCLITFSQALFNHRGIRLTSRLTDLSGYLIFGVTIVLIVSLLAFAPHLDAGRLVSFKNYSGDAGGGVWPQSGSLVYLFLLGLLLPAYTVTGFDASAHTAEETIGAARAIPRGMIHSVFWSGLIGWIMLSAIVLAAPDLDKAAGQGGGAFFSIMDGVLPAPLKILLYLGIAVSQYLCGLACVTSASRMIFAFARDGGLPGSGALRAINPRFRTPVTAIWTASILSVLFTIYAPVYSTIAAVCTIFLYISYLLPVAAGLLAHRRSWVAMGPFDLGIGYRVAAVVCILGCAVLIFIGIQPPNDQALTVTLGALVLAALVWFGLERRRFAGPPMGEVAAGRRAAIAAAEQAVGEA